MVTEITKMIEQPQTQITCTDCGKTAIVPFKPTPGKPIYCRECLPKHRITRTDTGRRAEPTSPKINGEKQAWAQRRKNWIN
jgi:CxxC-x17-CxxC domain-containing protein